MIYKLQPFLHEQKFASLSEHYRSFHGKCYNELHSLVPPTQKLQDSDMSCQVHNILSKPTYICSFIIQSSIQKYSSQEMRL